MQGYKVGKSRPGICARVLVSILVLLFFVIWDAGAQTRRRGRDRNTTFNQAVVFNRDSVQVSDSVRARLDSLHRVDSLFKLDSIAMMKQSSLDAPAFSGAKDSIREVFSDGQRKAYYYGDVTVEYGNMKLTADYMEYDMKTGTV